MPRIRSLGGLRASAALVILCASVGCSHNSGAIKPMATERAYMSPLAADPKRTGEFRPDGLVSGSTSKATPTHTTNAKPTGADPAIATSPQFIQLGAVIAEVNGKPIYAHRVLKIVANSLRPAAAQLDSTAFRARAKDEIRKVRDELIADELFYAAAERESTSEEKEQAKHAASNRYDKMISDAGGSEATARSKADNDDDGLTFDEELEQFRRGALVYIHEQKRLMPQAIPAVDDVRKAYLRDRNTKYTTPGVAKFRVIRIDIAQAGGEDAARKKAEEVRQRVAAGDDFGTLAADYNSDKAMRDAKGEFPRDFTRGSFVFKDVEDAVWNTEVNKITPAIKVGNWIYVAQPLRKDPPVIKPFPEVQDDIRQDLTKQKLLELRMAVRMKLVNEALLHSEESALDNATTMAMQLYGQWRSADASSQ